MSARYYALFSDYLQRREKEKKEGKTSETYEWPMPGPKDKSYLCKHFILRTISLFSS